jgi:prepilin-type N-terminal cleavage/methylation domain-containing protein
MILSIGSLSQLKNRGFTFIELILVAIIISVLAGLTTPLFRKPLRSIRLKNTCRNLVHLMRYAQAKSIAERKLCRINLDLQQGAFWLTEQDEDGSFSADGFERLQGTWGRVVYLPDGISLSAEAPLITFYPDGSSDRVKLKIFAGEEEHFAITAQRNIAYVQVEE